MAKDVIMPLLSPSMTEGTLVRWLKKEGDTVKAGEVIAEVETDKATMDLEAFDSGILRKILAGEGSKVAVNSRIGIIGTADEPIDAGAASAPAPEIPAIVKASQPALDKMAARRTPTLPPPVKFNPQETPAAAAETKKPAPFSRVKASPLAKKIAREQGVSVAALTGTGPGGRITKKDVLQSSSSDKGGSSWGSTQGPVASDEHIPLTGKRRIIAERLLESKTTIPHFYLEVEIDAAPLSALRASVNDYLAAATPPVKVSLNDFVLKACTEALRKVPAVNASFRGDHIHQYGQVHMAFAVALPDGLITPVIFDANNKSLKDIAREARALAGKARDGKLRPEEFQGGTFTVSNLGMAGIERFSAIINPPQAAILAVGAVVKKPVVNDKDEIVPGQRMSLTLSCDHRVVDGAVGAEFLAALKHLLENPAVLLL